MKLEFDLLLVPCVIGTKWLIYQEKYIIIIINYDKY